MYVRMLTYVYIHIHTYIYICIYIRIYIFIHIHTHARAHTHAHTRTHTHTVFLSQRHSQACITEMKRRGNKGEGGAVEVGGRGWSQGDQREVIQRLHGQTMADLQHRRLQSPRVVSGTHADTHTCTTPGHKKGPGYNVGMKKVGGNNETLRGGENRGEQHDLELRWNANVERTISIYMYTSLGHWRTKTKTLNIQRQYLHVWSSNHPQRGVGGRLFFLKKHRPGPDGRDASR